MTAEPPSSSVTPPSSRGAGRIVTFYSFKGGTGRSMALANVAWLFAANGLRVLAIDWDLEAPGLHRYFHPFIEDKNLTSTPGIIDYFDDVNRAARRAYAEGVRTDSKWFLPYTSLLRYSRSLDFDFPDEGTIDLVAAGQQDPSYAERVTSFDWRDFYRTLGGGVVLEALKKRLRVDYDFVLIDSRTGVSDTSGICTVQMPDDLVVLFTLNRQSVLGARAATQSALEQRRRPDGSSGLRVFPIRTRVERVEVERLIAAKDSARAAFADCLTHLPEAERDRYWGSAEIPYQPFYAHEEVLAPFGDGEPDAGSVLLAMHLLAQTIASPRKLKPLEMSREERRKGLLAYLPEMAQKHGGAQANESSPLAKPGARRAPGPVALSAPLEVPAPLRFTSRSSPASSTRDAPWVYVSYARLDGDRYLPRFISDLAEEIRARLATEPAEVFFDQGLAAGDSWQDQLLEPLSSCRVALCLYSPAYFVKAWNHAEFSVLAQRAAGSGNGIVLASWVPVARESMWHGARDLVGFAPPSGFRMLAQRRNAPAYRAALSRLAEELVSVGLTRPLAPAAVEDVRVALRNAQDAPVERPADDPTPDVGYVLFGPDHSPEDWRPFGGPSLHELVRVVASRQNLRCSEVRLPGAQPIASTSTLIAIVAEPRSNHDHVRILAELVQHWHVLPIVVLEGRVSHPSLEKAFPASRGSYARAESLEELQATLERAFATARHALAEPKHPSA